MANALRQVKTKIETIEIPDGVTLYLTQNEAETLLHVTSRIGGSFEGPRGHMEAIGRALTSAGIKRPVLHTEEHNRAIYYKKDQSSIKEDQGW